METIIGLLVVLLPVIFKLIGRKLEAAAQEQQKLDKSPDEWEGLLKESTPPAELVVAQQQQPKAQAMKKTENRPVSVKQSSPILQDEVKKPKEKIDSKKLIVYSEIMRPKYNE